VIVGLAFLWASLLGGQESRPVLIGNHPAVFSSEGILKPWTTWDDALHREMAWYRNCPKDGKFARCVSVTFMDGKYERVARRKDSIPAMQCATGILSYLGYDQYINGSEPWVIDRAREFADYIIEDASTPDGIQWPLFPRSTGKPGAFPQTPDCGSQSDHAYEVEPDKGGLFGYALVKLWEKTKEPAYLDRAVKIAQTLADHMGEGSKAQSPWPFRVDYRTGDARGLVSADMGYPLALFDALGTAGHPEFKPTEEKLWAWIKRYQLPSAKGDGKLWVAFFEDYDMESNRNSWSATNLARILMDRKEAIDHDWLGDSRVLIDYATAHFVSIHNGVPVCGEQDDDMDPWGGALTNYGSCLAMYAKASGNPAYKSLARQALNFAMYAIDDDGCPGQCALYKSRGGWQEDAHTDVIHNFMDALTAFPEWATER